MKLKSIDLITGGEVLAEPVLTKENSVLIPKGTQIREEYISLIRSLGIDSLMIEDLYEDFERPNLIISREKLNRYVNWVRSLMEQHIYGQGRSLKEFEVIAYELIKEMDGTIDFIIDMKERSADLYEHTVMVTLLSIAIGKKLELEEEKIRQIAIGSLLHDIGIRYITVPYENTDMSRIDAAKIFEYKKHTILGYSALEHEKWIPPVSKKMILSHHEKLDGSGFPMKQKNKEIECRIIQICDTFDRYISGMECKRTSVLTILNRLKEQSEILYDKKITDILVSMVAKYPVGTRVLTSERKHAVVISQTSDPENPVIMMTDSEKIEKNLMLEKHISILNVV